MIFACLTIKTLTTGIKKTDLSFFTAEKYDKSGIPAVGYTIHIKGYSTDFTQKIESIQIEHKNAGIAKERDNIGIKVKDPVREHDIIYRVTVE
ncbi:MAG: hypothetical protein A2Y97_11000 [Nitrospirae bacterium RBG_13_39_12]|nr:MAG: hypothetical protein A2Y97_11000 [Nitrospirae bacterium RBG_13_39_12]